MHFFWITQIFLRKKDDFYQNVWKSGELSTGRGLEVRPREMYVNIPNHSFELSRVLPLSISMY